MSCGQQFGLDLSLLADGYFIGSLVPLSTSGSSVRGSVREARTEFLRDGFGSSTEANYETVGRVFLAAAQSTLPKTGCISAQAKRSQGFVAVTDPAGPSER